MNIAGIGIVFNRGRGLPALEKALEEGWVPPTASRYSVSDDFIKDRVILKEMRRADTFSKMACLAAHDAVADSGLSVAGKSSLGIILASALGPYVTTFRFLDDILQYGDAKVSPTVFSHSVHNAAVSYIALCLQSRGPTLTITQFSQSFYQALLLAEAWMLEDRCTHVLVGSAEQCDDILEYVCRQKIHLAEDGKIEPFLFSESPKAVPGEGSVFFLLDKQETSGKYGKISIHGDNGVQGLDMYLLECSGLTGDEAVYRNDAKAGPLISSYTPLFGSMMSGIGFSCAAAALMLKNQRYYAAPVQSNPHNAPLCGGHQSAPLNTIRCISYGCHNEKMEFTLKHAHG
ncbi:MAG TPA: beta-ketoacyl synthase chain length factor [Candidatus Hydrogenedentes bacterium]|nr:beta-ketoacyl synthase chain length factor [Candidatus Hydrogenedentota bacterium]